MRSREGRPGQGSDRRSVRMLIGLWRSGRTPLVGNERDGRLEAAESVPWIRIASAGLAGPGSSRPPRRSPLLGHTPPPPGPRRSVWRPETFRSLLARVLRASERGSKCAKRACCATGLQSPRRAGGCRWLAAAVSCLRWRRFRLWRRGQGVGVGRGGLARAKRLGTATSVWHGGASIFRACSSLWPSGALLGPFGASRRERTRLRKLRAARSM